jgi:hypothetical protein
VRKHGRTLSSRLWDLLDDPKNEQNRIHEYREQCSHPAVLLLLIYYHSVYEPGHAGILITPSALRILPRDAFHKC